MVKENKAPDPKEINLKTSALLEAFPFYVMLIDEDHHILMANSAVQSSLALNLRISWANTVRLSCTV